MVDRFFGNWQLTKSENFDEYMKAVGVSLVHRKVGNLTKPLLVIGEDDHGVMYITSRSFFKAFEIKFKLNEEFESLSLDGRNVKSVFTLENDKLLQQETWDGKDAMIEREIRGGQLLVTCTLGEVVALRTYEKEA